MSLSNVGMGVVVAIFSLVGFESSTAFGDESVNPLKTIPRSIVWSLVLTGVFFIFVSYIEVLGTHGYKDSLDKIDAPLNVLADTYGVPFLSPVLSAGAMFSFFALASSCMNAGARVMYAMGRHQFFHRSTGVAHEVHGTPHVALGVMAVVMLVVVTLCRYAFSLEVLDEFNDAGTMGAFGFLGAYFLVTLAAPVFVKKRNELKGKDVAVCVAAVVLMLIPAIGSVYPVPDPPVRYFPYIFLGYLLDRRGEGRVASPPRAATTAANSRRDPDQAPPGQPRRAGDWERLTSKGACAGAIHLEDRRYTHDSGTAGSRRQARSFRSSPSWRCVSGRAVP